MNHIDFSTQNIHPLRAMNLCELRCRGLHFWCYITLRRCYIFSRSRERRTTCQAPLSCNPHTSKIFRVRKSWIWPKHKRKVWIKAKVVWWSNSTASQLDKVLRLTIEDSPNSKFTVHCFLWDQIYSVSVHPTISSVFAPYRGQKVWTPLYPSLVPEQQQCPSQAGQVDGNTPRSLEMSPKPPATSLPPAGEPHKHHSGQDMLFRVFGVDREIRIQTN